MRVDDDEAFDLALKALHEGDIRSWRVRVGALNPQTGVWWDEPGVCSVCGPSKRNPNLRDEELVRDHCHYTGLARGWLCRSCNVIEGKNNGALWQLWRLTAPWLAVGQRWLYGPEGWLAKDVEGRPIFSHDELLTLPMEHLIAVLEEHRQERQFAASAVCAQMAERAFGPKR